MSAFTNYVAEYKLKLQKEEELQKIETTLKPLVQEYVIRCLLLYYYCYNDYFFVRYEIEIAKLKEDIELFENEYKDVKANFEGKNNPFLIINNLLIYYADQDFNFTGLQFTISPYQEIVHINNSKTIIPVLVEIKIGY